MMNRFATLTALTASAVLAASSVSAATFTTTIGLDTFTIVEADPFKAGDTPGNTLGVASPASPWGISGGTTSDELWRERTASAFATGYTSLSGATDRLYELQGSDLDNAPELQTTVSGLAAADYEVFVVYITRNDGNPDDGRIEADLNAAATTVHDSTNFDLQLSEGSSVWDMSLASLGSTGGGATGFTVNVAGSFNSPGSPRSSFVGVAYRVVPEPGSLALLGLGGLFMLRRRRNNA